MKEPTARYEERSPAVKVKEASNPCAEIYEPPRLVVLGEIRTLTMGRTPGFGDSTNSFTEES